MAENIASLEDDPACIVGMACRLPGGIGSPSELWDFLMRKGCSQGPIPAQRFNKDGFYHQDGSSTYPGLMSVDGGYFLDEDLRAFDNAFFGIHNLEAASMDPQQRKLLEVVYECLDHAGTSMEKVSGTDTGVFVGNFTLDYQMMKFRDIDAINRFTVTGCGSTILANRISHVFNLKGPSFTVDTACSSSLYALHSAVAALAGGDCDAAVVAAANLFLSPEQYMGIAKAGVLSPTSTCHTFDIAADGYGRGEAVNALYIKRLSSALKDGDKVWAVIRSTAVNANGTTTGITQPSANCQEAVVRKAYTKAGLDFADSDYIECHGTGTPVGDPIEVEALGRCFGKSKRTKPLLLGSSKPGLGHSEAASGITALIKVALAFDQAKIPPTYGVENLNPKLKLDSLNMKIATEAEDWPRELRRASINAFGYGGSNSHVLLESPDSYLAKKIPQTNGVTADIERSRLLVLPISAGSPPSLDTRINQVRRLVESGNDRSLFSLVHTLAERTSHLTARHVLFAKFGGPDAQPELLDHAMSSDSVQTGDAGLPLAFVFTGQGAQYAAMGKELLLLNGSFRASICGLDQSLKALLPPKYALKWTLEDSILDPPEVSHIHEASRSQPVCTAIQIALVDILRSWNVTPSSVVGHSSGEIAAAYAAGLLSASQAIITAYLRGYAVERLTVKGAMLAAGIGLSTANNMISEANLEQEVSVACINSPASVTLSGTVDGITRLMGDLQRQGKFARMLRTGDRAYHSFMMTEVGELYQSSLAPYFNSNTECDVDTHTERPAAVMYSSVMTNDNTHAMILDRNSVSAEYWRHNLEQPVQFSNALSTLLRSHKKVHLMEVGPNPALKGPIQDIRSSMKLDQTSVPYSCTLVRNQDADYCMKQLAGVLFLSKKDLPWQKVNQCITPTFASGLPPYPWDYSAGLMWEEPRSSIELRHRQYPRHELLGSQRAEKQGINWAWKNVLTTTEIPWLRDHKLESQIVFPASAYIAMAVEALSQARNVSSDTTPAFEFRHVDISAALVVPDDETRSGVEVHTVLSARELTRTSRSKDWFEFHISSLVSGATTVHCSGSIRLVENADGMTLPEGVSLPSTDGLEECSDTGIFYDKFASQGLHFGPTFQSVNTLHVDSGRVREEAIGSVNVVPAISKEPGSIRYAIHPITLDSCIQIAIMGSAAGDVSETNVFLPVFIDECRVVAAGPEDHDAVGVVQSTSAKTSVSTRRMASTFWKKGHTATPLIYLKGVRLTQYKAAMATDSHSLRQPSLRVHWMPDVSHLHTNMAKQLDRYVSTLVAKFRDTGVDFGDDVSLAAMSALADLAGHGNPSMRVLELGNDNLFSTDKVLELLDDGPGYRRCSSWQLGRLDDSGVIQRQCDGTSDNGALEGSFELLFVQESANTLDSVGNLDSLLSDKGFLVTRSTPMALKALRENNFTVNVLDSSKVILATRLPAEGKDAVRCSQFVIVTPNVSSTAADFAAALQEHLLHEGAVSVQTVKLDQVNDARLDKRTICISLLELEHEFLATLNQVDMDHLRALTNTVTTIIWLSGADALGGSPNPDLTLSNGFSRALMLEHPSLNFVVIDVGLPESRSNDVTIQNVVQVLGSCEPDASSNTEQDKEFVQKDGLLFVSRFRPDFEANSLFRRRVEKIDAITEVELSAAHPARLTTSTFNGSETLHFEEVREPVSATPDGFVDILVKAISLNAKDVYGLRGKVETPGATTATEFSGVVTATGRDITHLKPGDSVAVGMACHFATSQRAPVWAVQKMMPGEQHTVMSTLPTIYATALYALVHRARLCAGESVLIHGGSGAFGFAAITVAKRILGTSTNIYTTAGTQDKRDFVADKLGIPPANIFRSRDDSFARNVKSATNGRGVDVIINFLTGDLLQATWDCVAPFGRFIEIGKRDLADAGRLDMHVFLRNATFTAFDLGDLYHLKVEHGSDVYPSLMTEVFNMYRSKQIEPPPITTFAASDIAEAHRYFLSADRVGKIVISLEQEDCKIPVTPSRYSTLFDGDKVYLLIGCLGGLGRSLGRWMVARGARHLVFLGRSGSDKASAKALVARLEQSGASVKVVRGNVTSRDDVDAVVSTCVETGKTLGGVVQAAMGLHEALFAQMTSEQWQTAIQPKWRGTWNLHEALEGHNLDFFLLTSSISGSVGTATESNYCAANSFLDGFARWRSLQGKPTISVGLGMISEVGYLHENPDIEALLLRKGIQPLTESEFLQIIDLALSETTAKQSMELSRYIDDYGSSHILTGLEPLRFRELISKGYDVSLSNTQDPRLAVLAAALAAERLASDKDGSRGVNGENADVLASAAEWFKGVPAHARAHLTPEADADSLQLAMLKLVRKRFSSLIITPVNQIDDSKPLARFGVDSMIASEFRIWFWTAFRVDVPFLDMLSSEKNLGTLAEFAAERLLEG
ncbi:Uu.00g013240.m01.CDS01 [Anthostomella pinea]|uniref:Uu.00g013240.m01.CDS01 n=1 Tax=Anthostomella pinea TaxID=933095 RepID=A0AAI8YQA4_9PEZI|nr:Uu.00g013240.m01.CDS01 [Anthostomella pinea]